MPPFASDDGTRIEWSSWLVGGELVCQAWLRSTSERWSKGPSFMVTADKAKAWARMLACANE